MIDLHNHILPAWDDGPATLTDTFKMARQAVGVGTTIMVATPHRMSNGGLSLSVHVRERVGQLNLELAKEGIPLEIVPGVEIPISNTIIDEVERGEMCTLGDGNYLLLEPPFPNLPNHLLPSIEKVINKGYGVILAHPERNAVVQNQWVFFRNLDFVTACAELGCVIQLTSGSIVGRFGRSALEVCKAVMRKKDWKTVIASDSHDTKERTPAYLAEAQRTVAVWTGNDELALNMVERLPREIIGR